MDTTHTVKSVTNFGTYNTSVAVPVGAVVSIAAVEKRITKALTQAAQEQGLEVPAIVFRKHIVTPVAPTCDCGGPHASTACPFRD